MSALANPADAHHAAAVAHAEANRAAGLSINLQTKAEFLARYTQADLDNLIAKYGIRIIDELPIPHLEELGLRLQKGLASASTKKAVLKLGDGDAKNAAAALLKNERLATADEQLFKRAWDLGIDVEYVGSGPAANRCNTYASNVKKGWVTIPPP
jgi:hypothetical protein